MKTDRAAFEVAVKKSSELRPALDELNAEVEREKAVRGAFWSRGSALVDALVESPTEANAKAYAEHAKTEPPDSDRLIDARNRRNKIANDLLASNEAILRALGVLTTDADWTY